MLRAASLVTFAFAAACSSSAVVDPRGAPVAGSADDVASTARAPAGAALPAATVPVAPGAGPCGFDARDWCPAPPGDPCGAHKDAASCKADASCVGMHYRGPSLVRCAYDARGFAANCPTVGCVSR